MGDKKTDSTEDDLNSIDRKLTFIKHRGNSTYDKIDSFQKMTSGGVFGSGRCGYHHVKLERSVQVKRMSVCSNGVVKWEMKEVTSLVCPGAWQMRMERFSDVPVSHSDSAGTDDNEKKVKLREKRMNQ